MSIDTIVVGGGSVGCVHAPRLSEDGTIPIHRWPRDEWAGTQER